MTYPALVVGGRLGVVDGEEPKGFSVPLPVLLLRQTLAYHHHEVFVLIVHLSREVKVKAEVRGGEDEGR